MIARVLGGIAALAAAVALAGCGAEPLAVRADGCWGSSGDCRQAKSALVHALGGARIPGLEAAPDSPCAGLIDCSEVAVAAATPTPAPRRTPDAAPRSTPRPVSTNNDAPPPRSTPEPVATPEPAATPEATPEPAATPEATPQPTPPPQKTPEPVAAAGGSASACGGMDITALGNKASLSAGELSCLKAVAAAGSGYSDPDVQTAAVSLFNAKASGWPKSVEAALKRGGLKNAPRLNFAGVKPAYDGGRYSTVLSRSRKVWSGLKSGLALSSKERAFVAEYACRSAGQLVLSGKSAPNDGLDWCERWLDLAERSGGSTAEIEDLIEQVE